MPYCIYLRKSRSDADAEARGEGETLARHKQALLVLSKKLNISITNIYREVVSGDTISARPIMQQLLNDVENGLWDGVLVMEVERLARGDTVDQGIVAQTFKYSNTKIITPMKTYNPSDEFDEEYFEFGLFMSRREYKTINRRLQRGRMASVNEGKFVGNKTPYGYKRIKIEGQKGYSLEPDENQAEIVKLIFEWYTIGVANEDGVYERIGVAKIARRLNELGIKSATGDIWTNATLQNLIRNPVYMGKIRWNNRPSKKQMVDGHIVVTRPRAKRDETIEVQGLHEPIITEVVFELAQKYMTSNPANPTPRDFKIKNPLSGIIRCGLCGRSMVRRPYTGDYPDTLMCPIATCKNVSVALYMVEQKLLSALQIWLNQYKVSLQSENLQNNNSQLKTKQKAINALTDEFAKLEKQRNNLHDLLEQGVYTTDVFIDRSKIVSERIVEINNSINALKKEFETDEINSNFVSSFIPRVEIVLKEYVQTSDPAIKNKLLKEVVDKAVYFKAVGGRFNGRPDDFQIDLYPKLQKK